MEDGTILAGVSPDTGRPFYVLPKDFMLMLNWNQATKYATLFEGHGHPVGTFRLPTRGELDVLFNNHSKIGGFVTGHHPDEWYWSSANHSEHPKHYAWQKRFNKELHQWSCFDKNDQASVRLVHD